MGENLSARAPLISRPQVIHINPASINRKKVESEGLLDRFSKWGHYKQEKPFVSQASSPSEGRKGLNRRSSIRRTDFTNTKEYNQHQKQKKFIFHRGFFKRNNHGRIGSDNRIRLKNRAELNSALQYIDVPSLEPEDVISSGRVATFTPTKLRQRTATVVLSSVEATSDYSKSLHRKGSIKRTLPPAGRSRNASRSSSLRRSQTARSSSIKSSPFRNLILRKMWKEYLFLVVFQRLRLRVALLKDDSPKPSETKESLLSNGDPSSASFIMVSRKAQ